jgi:hypothetical protein
VSSVGLGNQHRCCPLGFADGAFRQLGILYF